MAGFRFQIRQIACLIAVTGTLGGCSSTLTMPRPSTTPQGKPVVISEATKRPQGQSIPAQDSTRDTERARAVDTALAMVGAPYRYGGATPAGFDCSGLVYYAYDAAGVSLPRTTAQQLRASNSIALREAREGDLLFFEITSKPDHVGIFIGNGQFVHAPSSGKLVSIASLDDPYWHSSFVSARRLDL